MVFFDGSSQRVEAVEGLLKGFFKVTGFLELMMINVIMGIIVGLIKKDDRNI